MSDNIDSNPFSLSKVILIIILAPLIAYSFLDNYQAVTTVFLLTMFFWFTGAIPLPVTALLVPILTSIFGLVKPEEAFAPFGSDILYLFLGCFLMGISMEKYGFDKRVAYWLLSRCLPGESLLAVNFVIAGASFVLSMWISNTAAAAIISTVTIGILASLETKLNNKELIQKVSTRFLLSCAFASSIGGLATPIGSPPNLIALKFLEDRQISVSFIDWMKFGLPISLLMFVMMFIIFECRYPIRGMKLENIREEFSQAFTNLGKWSRGEKQIVLIFLFTIILWILPGIMVSLFPDSVWAKSFASRLSMSVVGLLGGISAFFLPVSIGDRTLANLEWSVSSKVDWGTILLFGGGLSLGNLLEKSGAAKAFGEFAFQSGSLTLPLLVATIIVTSILLSEFASNTAATAILIPLVIAAIESMGINKIVLETLVLCVAFSASFGFMLPVSTPPNAIVYGTGKISSKDMMYTGIWFDICGAIVITGFIGMMLL